MDDRQERGLIFLHMPKAGGSTLRQIIRRQFRGEVFCEPPALPLPLSLELSEEDRRRVRVVQGHVPFGVHTELSVPVDYITLLREPVERVVSMYFYARDLPGARLHPLAMTLSLAEFAGHDGSQAANQQTRLLSGGQDKPSPDALEAAKENLVTRVACAGVAERFDESLLLMKRRLGWRDVYYRRINVSRARPRLVEIPPATRERMAELNALDAELFAFACEQLDAKLRAQPLEFHAELRRFRRVNRVYRTVAEGVDPARRALPASTRHFIGRNLRAVRAITRARRESAPPTG